MDKRGKAPLVAVRTVSGRLSRTHGRCHAGTSRAPGFDHPDRGAVFIHRFTSATVLQSEVIEVPGASSLHATLLADGDVQLATDSGQAYLLRVSTAAVVEANWTSSGPLVLRARAAIAGVVLLCAAGCTTAGPPVELPASSSVSSSAAQLPVPSPSSSTAPGSSGSEQTAGPSGAVQSGDGRPSTSSDAVTFWRRHSAERHDCDAVANGPQVGDVPDGVLDVVSSCLVLVYDGARMWAGLDGSLTELTGFPVGRSGLPSMVAADPEQVWLAGYSATADVPFLWSLTDDSLIAVPLPDGASEVTAIAADGTTAIVALLMDSGADRPSAAVYRITAAGDSELLDSRAGVTYVHVAVSGKIAAAVDDAGVVTLISNDTAAVRRTAAFGPGVATGLVLDDGQMFVAYNVQEHGVPVAGGIATSSDQGQTWRTREEPDTYVDSLIGQVDGEIVGRLDVPSTATPFFVLDRDDLAWSPVPIPHTSPDALLQAAADKCGIWFIEDHVLQYVRLAANCT